MKQSKFSETQIVGILKEAEAGISVEDLSRKLGFSKSAFYKWKAKYSGMDASALSRLKDGGGKSASEADVCRFESGAPGAEGHCQKKAIKPDERRELVVYAMNEHGLSERQACQMLNLSRSVFRYQGKRPDDNAIKQELLALAARKPRWGFGMMLAYLKSNGHAWNHKRIRRVYCELIVR